MNPVSVAALAFGMSADAFAAALGKGAVLERPGWREALRTGAIFGLIEALTPALGWALGSVASNYVADWDHWIAFTLLGALGLKMVWEALHSGAGGDGEDEESARQTRKRPARHSLWLLAATGFATSIDAMVVGAGLAFVDVDIVPVAIAIGCATFVMVTLGVMLGRVLGAIAGRRAELAGGLLLIGIGSMILVEHLRAAG